MAKWFQKLPMNRKALFIMAMVALVVFFGLCPLFFFHLWAYPLGWLLGSTAELLAYLSLMYFSDSLFKKNDAQRSLSATMAAGSAGLRILLYAVVLVVAGICTFKPEWFHGFDAFNFYTTAAGLLPMLGVIFFTQLYEIKHVSSTPQGSDAKPTEGDQK
jgi:uncharacterized membrane protein